MEIVVGLIMVQFLFCLTIWRMGIQVGLVHREEIYPHLLLVCLPRLKTSFLVNPPEIMMFRLQSEGKPSMHKVITSKAEAWIGKTTLSRPWKEKEQEGSEVRTTPFVQPWLDDDQENDSTPHKSHSSSKPFIQVIESNRLALNEDSGSWTSFKANSTTSASSSECTNSNVGNKVDVDIDCLHYEVLWEDMIIGEQIGQVDHVSSAQCMLVMYCYGSCGPVYHGLWDGADVAVKVFFKQEFPEDVLLSFRQVTRDISYEKASTSNRSAFRGRCDFTSASVHCHRVPPTVGDFGLSRLKHETFLLTKTRKGTELLEKLCVAETACSSSSDSTQKEL